MLIEADPGGEGKVRTDADEQAAPLTVDQVEVVLHDPAPRVLEMPPIVSADGNQDARRLAGFQDHDDLIGIGTLEIPLDEVVPAPIRRRLDNRRALILRPRGDSVLVLAGDVLQHRRADGVQLAVPVEEADDTFGLLKRLNQAVQQDPIEAPIGEPDTILMMLVEGVHGRPPGVATRQDKPMNAATGSTQILERGLKAPDNGPPRGARQSITWCPAPLGRIGASYGATAFAK